MRAIYSFFLILFASIAAYGQVAVTISKEKVNIDGKLFYAHHVKPKETLYSLGKAYNVTTDDIIKQNASLKSGLKAGTIIYIPVVETASANTSQSAADKSSGPSENGGKMDKGNISAGTAGTAGEKEQQPSKREAKKPKYKKHTVKWYEDITDISEKYGVSVESLIALNNLKSTKLKSRQVLLIPSAEYLAGKEGQDRGKEGDFLFPSGKIAAPDSTAVASAEVKEENDDLKSSDSLSTKYPVKFRESGDPIEIAYILPLNSIDTNSIKSNFMEFYAGSILALDEMKRDGNKITVNLYDESEIAPLHSILDKEEFAKNQLIIGPILKRSLEVFNGYSVRNSIPLISPLDQSAEPLAEENRNFIQMPAVAGSQIEKNIDELERYKNANGITNVVLIHQSNPMGDTLYINKTKALLDQKGIVYRTISYGILDGRDILPKMLSAIDTLSGLTNIAVVPSNSEAFVSDVVRNLDLCCNNGENGTKITLFGLSKWRNFETINVELFHRMNLHISLPYFVDYNDAEVKSFILKYRALYNSEPSPYAYQGYDITRYLTSLMAKYGNSFINMDHIAPQSLLQSDFELKRATAESPESNYGMKNYANRSIVYNDDLTITIIR